jgi:putative glutamine amidotransferase
VSGRPPLIGVTTSAVRLPTDARPLPEADPPMPELALGMVYLRAVERAGGVPVALLPLGAAAIGPLVDSLAGVCLSGGPDLDPSAYGAEPHPQLGTVEPELDAFELAVARRADALGLPVLGICRGAQTLNVARGGTLHQHVADVTDGSVDHRRAEPGGVATHPVRITPDSRLAQIVGGTEATVNSFHHQAVDRLGSGLRAVAWSPDGLVEAIEGPGPQLYLGVQWHAETLGASPEHARLFGALVEAAAGAARAAAA